MRKVFIIPDGSLNTLNFETLLVPDPTPHYWIEDVTIADANSLRLLAAPRARRPSTAQGLLLIGNAVAPNPDYPELRKAADEMKASKNISPARNSASSRASTLHRRRICLRSRSSSPTSTSLRTELRAVPARSTPRSCCRRLGRKTTPSSSTPATSFITLCGPSWSQSPLVMEQAHAPIQARAWSDFRGHFSAPEPTT